MSAIYNEIEPFAAEWMRNLIAAGHIAPGVVDERSIQDLTAPDVAGPGQRHFFAGIGVWSYALRLAGVSDDGNIWTGSCPCQPFSGAGKRGGFDDARHLWPVWFALIRECRPAIVFGEQVASPDGLAWLDVVSSDLEGAGYAFGAADLCAAGVGAPHIRQRLYFVADSNSSDIGQRLHVSERQPRREVSDADRSSSAGELADRNAIGLEEIDGRQLSGPGRSERGRPLSSGGRGPNGLGHANSRDIQRHDRAQSRAQDSGGYGADYHDAALAGSTDVLWSDADWIACTDGKHRPTQPGVRPLAHGATARVGRLRAYGNAIVAEVAATFIRAALGGAA